ncbi:competence protein CoiA family protein [Adhaeribacter terreus]|uniref:Competence protein CoiA family protein n=1 Tax=Adhaeribacter terreus TaxID=529703 RepID=A0ABW0EDN9_9BACT
MIEENFKIEFGINKIGILTSVDDAIKEEQYHCIECDSQLILKEGKIRQKHFSHIPYQNCNGETILHKTAKRLIYDVITKNRKNECSINLKIHCDNCDKLHIFNIKKGSFSDAMEEARVENFVCDVVGYRNGTPSLGIEIFQTHKVNDKKKEDLQLPWIELKATDVISNPYEWIPTQHRLSRNLCSLCKIESNRIKELCTKWNIDHKIYSTINKINHSKYLASTINCWKCKHEIPVFWWKGVPFAKEAPPQPSPWTIKNIFSKAFGGKYFANTCPNCNSVQGDNFIFLNSNSPFNKLPLDNGKIKEVNIVNEVRSVNHKEDIEDIVKIMFRGSREW